MGVEGIGNLTEGEPNEEQSQESAVDEQSPQDQTDKASDGYEQSQSDEQDSDVAEKNSEPSAPVDGSPPADAHETTQAQENAGGFEQAQQDQAREDELERQQNDAQNHESSE